MKNQMQFLILAAEREAQMLSAFARLTIITIATAIFIIAGGFRLPVASIVLTYLLSYGLISIISALFSLKRFFNPWMSLLFTAIDGISLALLIGFALLVTGSPMSLHGAVPGFVFIFSILILATMRYTIWPTLVVFLSFGLTWFSFSNIVDQGLLNSLLPTGPTLTPNFFFGTVQNSARWGFFTIATILCLLAVIRRRKTLEEAIVATNKSANLSRYMPDRIANLVAEQGIDALSLGGKQIATVLFVDIRGFTGISEQLEPEELSTLLSEFRTIVSSEVEVNFGIVDKFIGDAVMAVFGVPDEQPDDADCGINCAISIIDKMNIWNEKRQVSFKPPIEITIGVHCGEVFAGAVGAEDRMEYTVIGDTVNIAARLQELAKKTKIGLVVSQSLLDRSDNFHFDHQKWKALDDRSIRGRLGKLCLYSYIGPSKMK